MALSSAHVMYPLFSFESSRRNASPRSTEDDLLSSLARVRVRVDVEGEVAARVRLHCHANRRVDARMCVWAGRVIPDTCQTRGELRRMAV